MKPWAHPDGSESEALGSERRAFTLVELLVVVAVLALLAAFLLPHLQNARNVARQSICLEHIKQVGIAVRVMADENNRWVDPRKHDPPGTDWREAVLPYLSNKREMVFGSSDPVLQRRACPTVKKGSWGGNVYGINPKYGRSDSAAHPTYQLGAERTAVGTYLLSDLFWKWLTTVTQWGTTCKEGNGSNSEPRHEMRGLNFLFVDGHAEFYQHRGGFQSEWFSHSYGGPNPYNIIGYFD